MALTDLITEMDQPSNRDLIEDGGSWAPINTKSRRIRQSPELSEKSKISTVRDKLYEILATKGIEEANAIRVLFENGDTVLVVSQDNPALDRTDAIRKTQIVSSAEAGAKLANLKNMTIKIYQEEKHPRPHVHIDYGRERHVASYSVETGERIVQGTLPRKYDKDIRAFLSKHKESVLLIWRTMQLGGDPHRLITELQGDE